MKGLILSGGKGTRLRPITYTSAKQLVPVANKPVLFYAVEYLVAAGIDEVGIVVGDTRAEVKAAVGDGSRFGARVTYVEQDQPLGLAHAVKTAYEQGFLGEERFVMLLGDNLIEGGIRNLVERFRSREMNCQVILKQVPDPQNFGVAVLEGDRAVRLVEKPREFLSDLALVGIYMFDQNVREAVYAIQPSWRGELEITDAIQYLLEHGYLVRPYVHQGWWFDTGKMEDLLDVNRYLLETQEQKLRGTLDDCSRVYGRVVLEPGAELVGSVVRGPAIIGERTRVVNSYVGPFTSIYHDCLVSNSEIEHSIVMENCCLSDLPHRLEDSLIGRNVELSLSPVKPKAFKMMLGDNSKVGLL
ncbi:MAG: glucose-1-phosphate thymidylyltransferase [Chloroflexi bacterium]|nr:glucose-1-phosphate thymidylyltransferase [Chloroflexota bacterium]